MDVFIKNLQIFVAVIAEILSPTCVQISTPAQYSYPKVNVHRQLRIIDLTGK